MRTLYTQVTHTCTFVMYYSASQLTLLLKYTIFFSYFFSLKMRSIPIYSFFSIVTHIFFLLNLIFSLLQFVSLFVCLLANLSCLVAGVHCVVCRLSVYSNNSLELLYIFKFCTVTTVLKFTLKQNVRWMISLKFVWKHYNSFK